MAKREMRWVRVRKLTQEDKREIGSRCDQFIREVLKPRFLPQIRPTEFNYPIDIHGKWHGGKYRFMLRYRSGFPENEGEEFDSPFVRLDHDEEYFEDIRFDMMWHRHTGKWHPVYAGQTLEEALHRIATDPLFQPHT